MQIQEFHESHVDKHKEIPIWTHHSSNHRGPEQRENLECVKRKVGHCVHRSIDTITDCLTETMKARSNAKTFQSAGRKC